MAEESAVPAAASAAAALVTPGGEVVPSTVGETDSVSELLESPSFDVESLMADAESDTGETEVKDGVTNPTNYDENEDGDDEAIEAETDEETEVTDADEEPEAEDGEEPEEAEGDETEDGNEEETDEDGAEAEESTSSEAGAPEGLKPKAVKRFNQLLKQRDEALASKRETEQELERVRGELEARDESPTAVKVDGDPLAATTNEEQLEAHADHYQKVRSWCRRNPDGGTPPVELTNGKELDLDREDVVNALEKAEEVLEAVPNRRQFLARFKEARAKAREAHPEMFRKGTEDHKLASEIRSQLQRFHEQPDQDALVARLVKATRMERDEAQGAQHVKVKLKPKAPSATKPKAKSRPARSSTPAVKAAGAGTDPWARANAPGGSIDVEEILGD
jgi:hypothetical protein